MTNDHWTPPGPGPWMADKSHLPYTASRILQEHLPPSFARGFAEGFAKYGALLDRVVPAFVNGCMYLQPQPFDMPGPDGPKTKEWIEDEFGRRMGVAAEAFAGKIWFDDLRLWDEECKPRSIARHRELHERDIVSFTDEQLVDELRERAGHLGDMVFQHHRFNVSAIVPVGDFALQISALARMDPVSLLAVLDGSSPVSGVLSSEIMLAVAAVKSDPEAQRLVRDSDGDPASRLATLRSTVPAVAEWLSQTEFRIVDGLDVTRPTLAEMPEMSLGRLAAALDAQLDDANERARVFADSVRCRIDAEQQPLFDDLLESARTVNRLRDERGMYSDTAAIGLVRLGMLEAGRRLVAHGRLADPTEALEADLDELVGLLTGARSPTSGDLQGRTTRRAAIGADGAPSLLGPPPPPPPAEELPPPLARVMNAIGFMVMDGILGAGREAIGTDDVVGGIGIGTASYEGPARVVIAFGDLMELRQGEVLVTPATMESFNGMLHLVGAIVTDHGGFACHAAIMARELGFPAVVGTVTGTSRIHTGDRVRVDGGAANVTIIR